MRTRLAPAICAMLVLSRPAVSWGPTGHRAIGRIAEIHLTPQAAAAVQALIGPETLPMVSTWADSVRSSDEYKHTAPWHYVNIPDGESYETAPKNPDGDVVVAMRSMEKTLRDPNAGLPQRIEALKFLVHFVGDIHQPLHVGRIEDRGGNLTDVRWIGSVEPTNLHALWDSGLIQADGLSYTELAEWVDRAAPEQVREWQRATYLDYVRESMALRSSCYEFDPQARVGYSYLDAHLPTVYRRIEQAGMRLAGLLNSIFGR